MARCNLDTEFLKPALIAKPLQYPENWQALPQGEMLKQIYQQALAQHSRQFFGYYALKVGNLSSELELLECPVRRQVSVRADMLGDLQAQSAALPIAEHSVDSVLLAHELDFTHDPHQVLREADRVLIPNGYIAIIGFNPMSLAGIAKRLPFQSKKLIQQGRFFTSFRIKDWLGLLGYEVVNTQHLVFSSLVWSRRLQPSSKLGGWCQRNLSLFGSCYVIVAKKRVVPLLPIKPKWKLKPKFSPVSVSIKQGNSVMKGS